MKKHYFPLLVFAFLMLTVNSALAQTLSKGPFLMLTDDSDDEVTVAWTTNSTTSNTVEWGLTTSYGTSASGSYTTVTTGEYLHQYTLSSLTSASKYYYRVTVGSGSYTGSFRTQPSDTSTFTKFLVYSDPQASGTNHDFVAAYINSVYAADNAYQTLLLCAGDVADSQAGYSSTFFNAGDGTRNMLRNLFFETTKGNHDYGYNTYFSALFPYASGNQYYSFDYGPVHVAVVDEYTTFTSGSAQYSWLESDLAASAKPWKFILLHEPGWSGSGGHGNNSNVQTAIQPLCAKYNVPFVIGGHQHFYVRAEVTGTNVPKIRHITTSAAGGLLRTPGTSTNVVYYYNGQVRNICKVNIIKDYSMTMTPVNSSGGSTFDILNIYRPYDVRASVNSSNNGATISWETNTAATSSIAVQYAAASTYWTSSRSYTTVAGTLSGTTSQSITFTGLTSGTSYYFRVLSDGECSRDYLLTTGSNLYYRSKKSGTWTSASCWDASIDGTKWVAASSYPSSPAAAITVKNGHEVTVDQNASVSQLTIESGGSVIVSAGVTLTNSGGAGNFVINSNSSSSGSLLTSGSFSGLVTYNRYMPTGSDWHYVSTPLSLTSSPSGSFYAWNEPDGEWASSTTNTPLSGLGYTLHTTGNTVSFTGNVVTSVSQTATSPYSDTDFNGSDYNFRSWAIDRDGSANYGGGGFNLLGNPFTSAMNGTTFISNNSDSFDPNYKALYIFNGSAYYYIGTEMTGWENADGGIFGYTTLQVGQGFFVLANYDGVTFSFTSDMQTHDISVPMTKSTKKSKRWPGMKLTVKSNTTESNTLVLYNQEMTAGLDPGNDIGQLSAGNEINIYTALVIDNGVNFAQQALPVNGCDTMVVAVGVDYKAGGVITFSAEAEPLDGYNYILEDRRTGVLTDLSSSTYTVTLPANTYGTGRFFIHTNGGTTGIIGDDDTDLSELRIWPYNGDIIIKGSVSGKSVVDIYRINGAKIFNKRLTEGDYNILNVQNVKRGVYIIRVTDGDKVITKKVVLL